MPGRWHGPPPPPWRGRSDWHGDASSPWRTHGPAAQQKRRFLLGRLVMLLLLFTTLIFGGMAAMAFLITNFFGGDGSDIFLVWIGGCGLLFAIPVLMLGLGIRAYRRYATPLADVMAAADAVADGDLSVRVPERGTGEFARLSRSFNRMTEELAHTDQLRRNLTADVAHELRNPLHIIQGNLEGILDDVYAPTDAHIAATLEETRALTRLVEDLQTISAAEAGQLTLVTGPVDLAEVAQDLVTSLGPLAEAQGIDLRCVAGGTPAELMIEGDAGRIDQVLTNLVTNALRHTPAGGAITLNVAPVDDKVQLSVTDTGEGISPEDLPHIFDRFWRGDPARSHRDGASGGLGLAIARQLVEAHDGTISVESSIGEGTAFTIDFPRRNPRLSA